MDALSSFHPVVRRWFASRLGPPTPAQEHGWPLIRAGRHTLIAAPTGSGKTLAAFLSAIDGLLRQGTALADRTTVLYVSPLRALSNDVQKNLQTPLAELRGLDPSLPEVRVLVRTGDTPAAARTAMLRKPPHILVTTPESLYLMLTSQGGRALLASVRTVIVDEIHALVRDKRGSHLALSLERLCALAGEVQRIGLSATQKPLDEVGRFLVGTGRECVPVDAGSFRDLDLGVEIPPSALATVCSHEQWEEIYQRMAELVRAHRTTLVFVNTRKMAERIAAQLTRLLGPEAVTSHHGSLSRERRLDAEQRLKAGQLQALVATASLELGLDIGDVDLVIQVGATRSIATFLQRVGRAGHGVGRVPKGRLFPLTVDELVEAAALLRCVRRGLLDRTPPPPRPLDILAQQVVAATVGEPWEEQALYAAFRRAWPYRDLARSELDAVVSLHAQGRGALLHRDSVHGRLRATRRARLMALLSGGAIPDTADYQVRLEPEGTLVGTVNEDWAVEAHGGDIFQLGNASSRGRCAWPTPRALPRRSPSGWGRPRAARASWRRSWPPCARPWPTAGRPRSTRPAGPPCPRARRASSRSTSPRACRSWAPSPPRRGWSSSGSSTRAAACSSWCTPPSARASTGPWAWPCARSSASGSVSSCRPRPTRRPSSSPWGRSTASPWRRSSTTSTRTPRARSSSRPCWRPRCSRRGGAGTRSDR
jgi:ATP-dependent Lhr-like helicase